MTNNSHTVANVPVDVDVAIVGGGIGGLSLAVALRRAGIEAHVYERTKKIGEVGGAVVIREPSVKLFESWGVEARFYAEAVRVDVIDIRNSNGDHIRMEDADRNTHDGLSYSVHRADVYSLLFDAIAPENIHLGMTCVEILEQGDRGVVKFADGTVVRAKVVVGSDGIKSVTRQLIIHDELVFAGLVVLRGLAPASALPAGMSNDRLYLWYEKPRMMTLLPLRSGTEVAMDTIMNVDKPPEHLWTSEVPTQVLLDYFAGFAPALLNLIKAGTVPVRANPVYDRNPIKRWSTGRITLLGDAAHPMAPRLGQGANMAIQDAGALAAALTAVGLDNATEALQRYEQERIPPTAKMQLGSRKPQDEADAIKILDAK